MSATPGQGTMRQMLVQVGAGLILAGFGGISYLAYVVPRSLDQVLLNQRSASERLLEAERRISVVEGDVKNLGNRTTRLEAEK
jgi:hypothetical protein